MSYDGERSFFLSFGERILFQGYRSLSALCNVSDSREGTTKPVKRDCNSLRIPTALAVNRSVNGKPLLRCVYKNRVTA